MPIVDKSNQRDGRVMLGAYGTPGFVGSSSTANDDDSARIVDMDIVHYEVVTEET